MKLQMLKRKGASKSEAKRLRREGLIPAILYSQGKAGTPVTVKDAEWQANIRKVQQGRLPTTVFTLVDEKGKEHRAVIKEIQYHPTSYNVEHLDFEELHDKSKVNVKVPIECIGSADCVGIKQGGVLRQVIRYLRVRCFPSDIPEVFEMDVRNLNLRDTLRLSAISMPEKIRPLANLNEVAVVVVKR